LKAAIASLLAAAVLGCPSSPAPPSGPAASPAPAARVVLPSGAALTVELATTDAERSQGLMYRASMPQDAGMVFLFDGLEIRPFWMKNCHFPLDLIYTLRDGTIVDVLKNVPPCKADPCPSYPPKEKADTVVEVNAGIAEKNGAVAGAKLRFVGISGR
jgi:uncharacterized membrane protein (UPF0127 family)